MSEGVCVSISTSPEIAEDGIERLGCGDRKRSEGSTVPLPRPVGRPSPGERLWGSAVEVVGCVVCGTNGF